LQPREIIVFQFGTVRQSDCGGNICGKGGEGSECEKREEKGVDWGKGGWFRWHSG
jgi:hypothetical protein